MRPPSNIAVRARPARGAGASRRAAPSAALLRQLEDDPLGVADGAEPVAVLVSLQLADEFSAASDRGCRRCPLPRTCCDGCPNRSPERAGHRPGPTACGTCSARAVRGRLGSASSRYPTGLLARGVVGGSRTVGRYAELGIPPCDGESTGAPRAGLPELMSVGVPGGAPARRRMRRAGLPAYSRLTMPPPELGPRSRPWFVRRRYGVGYRPLAWQGWVITGDPRRRDRPLWSLPCTPRPCESPSWPR